MEARAHARFVKIAPRKVRMVMDLYGEGIGRSTGNSEVYPKSASKVIEKLCCRLLPMRKTTTTWTEIHCMLQNAMRIRVPH